MNIKQLIRRMAPALTAPLLFFVVAALYFIPQFQGDVLPQHDVVQFEGMAHDIKAMRAETGEDPQWTGGMFGGMPAYLIDVSYPAQAVKRTLGQVVKLIDTPAGFLFFALLSMWVMLLLMGVDWRPATVGALAYGLSTYFLLIIAAGHITKMWALVYAPLMMGGAWMTLRRSMWYGAVWTAVATSLEIGANHPQITYYFLMAMVALWISEAVTAVRAKKLADFGKRTALLAVAGGVAVLSNFAPLLYTAQHSPETIRGGSELVTEATDEGREGLSLEYATAWSYGRAESFNMLIPDFMGRDSATPLPSDGEAAAVLNSYTLHGLASQLPAYWGEQPYTGGPTYLGAAAIFLAVLGLCLLSGRNKWWMLAISVLMIFLAWGRHWLGLTEFFFRYLPGYDKFRTVSMTLVVVQWTVPLLGALALMQLWRDESRERLWKALAWATGVTGGLCLIFAVAGGALFDFGEQADTAMMTRYFGDLFRANNLQSYLDRGMDVEWGAATGAAIAADRAAMMQADAWRSLLMILLAAGGVALFAWRKIGRNTLVATMAVVVLIDLVPVDRRFLSSEQFVSPRRCQVTASVADQTILADRELGFRVLNLTVSPFNDATTSYFHRSVGGYHGAKLARYQDLIDRYLSDGDEGVLDMLNTRYLILPSENGAPQAVRRENPCGAAWFVDDAVFAEDAQEEIDLLGEVNLHTTAVVNQSLVAWVTGPYATEGERRIELISYAPNRLVYDYEADVPSLVIFSEIFYDKGWSVTIDDEPAEAFRADYILRAMTLPAGAHRIEWHFRAPGWGLAEAITGVASALILLGAVAALVIYLRKKMQKIEDKISENEK